MADDAPLTEERRLEIIESIRTGARDAGYPDYDVESRLAGELAGPATEGRPDLAPWDYLDYVAEHPGVTLDELAEIRFPVSFFEGGSSVTSLAEELRPVPLPPRAAWTVGDVIRRYAMMTEAGLIAWNSDRRAIEQLTPLSQFSTVYREWWNEVLDAAGS